MTAPNGTTTPEPPAPTTIPIQNTNILRFLAEHLPDEHTGIMAHIEDLRGQLARAVDYQTVLEATAAAARVPLTASAEPSPT